MLSFRWLGKVVGIIIHRGDGPPFADTVEDLICTLPVSALGISTAGCDARLLGEYARLQNLLKIFLDIINTQFNDPHHIVFDRFQVGFTLVLLLHSSETYGVGLTRTTSRLVGGCSRYEPQSTFGMLLSVNITCWKIARFGFVQRNMEGTTQMACGVSHSASSEDIFSLVHSWFVQI